MSDTPRTDEKIMAGMDGRVEVVRASFAKQLERELAQRQPPADVAGMVERVENYYAFECEGGPLRNCVDWIKIKDALAALATAESRAYQMLDLHGVPKERAKSVANGIDVLVTRMQRENQAQAAELADARRELELERKIALERSMDAVGGALTN